MALRKQIPDEATAAEAGSPTDDRQVHYTGVVLIHGIGATKRNTTLEEAVNTLAFWFNHEAGLALRRGGPKRVWVTAHLTDDPNPDAPAARATLDLVAPGEPEAAPDGDTTQRLEFREVWWAESIGLPSVAETTRWTLVQFGEQAANLLLLFGRHRGRAGFAPRASAREIPQMPTSPPPSDSAGASPSIASKPHGTAGSTHVSLTWPQRGLLHGTLWVYSLLQYVWKALQWLILVPLAFLVLLVIGLLRLLALLPPLQSTIVSGLSALLDRIMLHWIAEAQIYTLNYTRSAGIRERFEREVEAFLRDPCCDRLVVIAHSMGSVIAYEGLTTTLAEPDLLDNQTPVTFICLAQALRRLWRMTADDPHRLRGVLPERVRWLHFWARYDPVAAGPLSARSLPSLDPWPDATMPDPQPALRASLEHCENVAVVNSDSTFTDHTTYWQNLEQVVGPVAYELTAGHPMLQITVAEHLATSDDILWRRWRVAWRATVSLVGGLAAGAVVLIVNSLSGGAEGLAVWRFLTSQQTRAFLLDLITGKLPIALSITESLHARYVLHLPANPATVLVSLVSACSHWVVAHQVALVTDGAALLAAGLGILVIGRLVAIPSPLEYTSPRAIARRGARGALMLGLSALALSVLAYNTSPSGYDPFLAFERLIRNVLGIQASVSTSDAFGSAPGTFTLAWNAAVGAILTTIAAWLVSLVDALWTHRWAWAGVMFVVVGVAVTLPVTGVLFYALVVLSLLYGLSAGRGRSGCLILPLTSPIIWLIDRLRQLPNRKAPSPK